MAEKFPERLVIEDERTWLRIKDEQAEAKRMELKEGLEEYSDSEDETRTMVTEGLSDDEEEGLDPLLIGGAVAGVALLAILLLRK